MIAKPVSGLTGIDFEGDIEEGYKEDLPEESDRTESFTGTKEKSELILFPRKKGGETNSKDFEVGSKTHKAISQVSGASGSSHLDSEQISVGSKDLPSIRTSLFMEIMKMHLLDPILDAFDKIQPHANSGDAAVYINRILHTIREMEDRSPKDPFLDILFALYDALAVDNNWTKYTADQYAKAKEVLEKYSKRSILNQKAIEKAIVELEEIGFDTTPFTLNIETTKE
jgi:hypothetical protein